jgi:hypothetical protein
VGEGFLAWYTEFLLEINLKILLRKTRTRIIFKIELISLHIDSGQFLALEKMATGNHRTGFLLFK